MANYTNRKRDEEEERKRREAEQQAAQAQSQTAQQPEAQVKTPEPAKMATQAPAVGAPSPRGIPKLNRQQRFEVKQNVADQKTSTQIVQAGELDMLPEKLEPRRGRLEELNKAGKLGSAQTKQWSSAGNEIGVDVGSIKDVHQLAYFGTTLVSDKDREAVYKKYAKDHNLELDDVYYQAEQITGGKAFDSPRSNKGKLAAVGLYNFDGTELDPNTMTSAESLRALRMVPDSNPYKAAAKKAHISLYGWVPDEEFAFMDSADLTESDFNKQVKTFGAAFTFSDGATEANNTAYLEMLDEIEYGYGDRSPWVAKQLKAELDRAYAERTGVYPPDENDLRRMAEEATVADAPEAEGEEKGFFARAAAWVGDLFGRTEKAPKTEEPQEQEDEEAPEAGAVVRPGYYASTGVASGGSSAPASTYAAAGSAPEIQGPTYQPQAAEPEEPEAPAEVQGPVYQPQAQAQEEAPQESAEPRYVNAIPYDPDMTDAQALAYQKRGATLDPRNAAQIAWFNENRNAQGIVGGTGMYTSVSGEDGKRKAIDVYSYYGTGIGNAITVINNGSLPEDVQSIATLELGSVIAEIDRIVADPRNGITIPEKQNMYEYVLRMPEYEGLLDRVNAVKGIQNQVNEAYAAQAQKEAEAKQALVDSAKARVTAGNATADDIALIAEATTASDYIDLYQDEMYAVFNAQMNPMKANYFGDEKPFWQNGSAAAQEGMNLKRGGASAAGAYSTYKDTLVREVHAVLDDYTETAIMLGMTLEEYLGAAGIDSLDQIADIAYNNMQSKGNAYRSDAEAQEAAEVIATSDVNSAQALLMGAESGAKSYAADFAQTAYMALDEATYNLERTEIMNQYVEDYGYEQAAAMYYNDLMAYANSGKMDEASKADLLDHIARATNIFDVAFEIDATGIEGWARAKNYELQKDVDALAEIAQTLPPAQKAIFNLTSSGVNSLIGMGVSTVVGGVTGSAIVGSAVAYGTGEWANAYDENRAKGMSPGMAGWMALGNAGLTTAVNTGGVGSKTQLFFGDDAYSTFLKAAMGDGGKGMMKLVGKETKRGFFEEGFEELIDFGVGKTYDLLDEEALAIDRGEDFSLSRALNSFASQLEEGDPVALFKEAVYAFSAGAVMGGLFSVVGVTKTAVQASRGAKAQKKYQSLELANQLVEGKIPFTEENTGKAIAALQKDLEDPQYRRWIDSGAKAARDQRATMTAILGGAGADERALAVKEAQLATEYETKASAATEAAENATNRWIELRQQVANGDVGKAASLESARMLMGKANQAKHEATTAAQKARENSRLHMEKWLHEALKQSGIYKSQAMQMRVNQIAEARMQLAQRLAAQYEAEEAARLEAEAVSEAAAAEEIAYAENQVFPEEEWTDEAEAAEVDRADLDSMLNYAEAIAQQSEYGEATEAEEQELLAIRERSFEHMLDLLTRAKEAFDAQGNVTAYNELAREYNKIRNRISNIYDLGKFTPVLKEKAEPDALPPEMPEMSPRIRELYAKQAAREARQREEIEMNERAVFGETEDGAETVDAASDDASSIDEDEEIQELFRSIEEAKQRVENVLSSGESAGMTKEQIDEYAESERIPLRERKKGIVAREKARFNDAFGRMMTALESDDSDAADQIGEEYDRIRARLDGLGVNTDELVAEQYGYTMSELDKGYEQAQAQEAQRAETEKHERLTETLERQMAETAMKREQNAPARQYLMTRPIYVNESQAADILAAEDLKSIAQVNRRYHMQLTTDESANAMPLDVHVMNDINREAAGSVDESADPVGELLRVMQTGKELAAEQKRQQAQAKELQAKRKAADKRRRESVDALTGRNAEPVRQANQINALVANENSTVEQIDNAVDRIEGVSMSMNDGAEATVNQEQETLVESGYKDPAMQKLASDLYKNWGVRLRTADLDPRDEGFYDRDSNTIVLNKRLTSGERQRTVVMHELIHFCEAQPWYPQFKKDILAGAYSGEAEIEENRERLRDMGYAEKDLDFELVSHAAKPLFEGDEVLVGNLLENGKASAVKRAYAAIAQYIARRKAKKMGMGKQYDALLSARKTLAKGLKNAKATKANNYSAGGSVSHSYSGPVLSQYGNQTAQEVDWINQAVKDQLKGSTHEVQTDRAAIVETLSRIEELGGVQDALRDLMSRPVDRWNAQDQAMAQVLMAKAEYDGDVTTEAVVAMMYDKSGSEAGLTLQKRKLLARMDSQNALALVSRLASDFNMKNGGSSQYAPVGNGRPLEKIDGAEGDANGIIDRAKRVNDAIVAERGMDDIIERENRWGIPVTGAQMYLIEKYGLSHIDLPGAHYSRATVKQRMLAAILATDTDVVYDTDVGGNRNGLLGLIQQLEAMKAGKAVQTIADLTYISNQMAEMKAQSNGSEDPYLNTQEAKVALARAYDAINNVVPVTTGQRGGALAYMNMLSASTTGVKNVLGNVVMGPMEAAAETIAAAIDKVVSAKTKNRTTAVSTAQETADGLKEGLAELANTFADTYIYQTDTSYGRKYEMSGDAPRVYQNAPMEAKRRMVDFIMQLGDRPFFKAEYARQMDMIQRLCKEGKMKKKDVVSTPDGRQIVSYAEMTEADMHAEAAQRALERVFQEDNAIVNWVNSAPVVLRPFMQAVVPFVKTPTNIAKRMLDYSPIGLAKTLAVAGYHAAVKDGGFDQRKFVMGMGRGLTGTGMIMAGALLYSLGVLDIEDGYGEEDDGKLYGAGMANYDPYGKYINIDGNKTSLDWLGAAGIWMTIGAAAAKEWDEDTGLGEAMYSAMLKSGPEILNLLFDNTMLSSVSELLGGAEDGEELGTNVVETIVGFVLQQYFSPADIRQFAKFTDEYERDYRNDNPIIETINKNVIRYWPVLRQTLPIKYDITGDAVRQSSKYGWGRQDEDVALNFLNMYMSPTNIQSDKGDAALDEVIDLSYRLGDTSCIPSNLITTNGNITIPVTMAKKTTLGAGENKLTLSVDEQRKYNQMYASLCFNGTEKGRKYEKVGSGAYGNVRGIRDLIESREYQRADNQAKSDMIEDIMKQAKEIVRAQICIDRGYEK